jgi:hypothetical protein
MYQEGRAKEVVISQDLVESFSAERCVRKVVRRKNEADEHQQPRPPAERCVRKVVRRKKTGPSDVSGRSCEGSGITGRDLLVRQTAERYVRKVVRRKSADEDYPAAEAFKPNGVCLEGCAKEVG